MATTVGPTDTIDVMELAWALGQFLSTASMSEAIALDMVANIKARRSRRVPRFKLDEDGIPENIIRSVN